MAGKLGRFLKHAFTTAAHARKLFPPEVQARLQQAIADGEARHRAELRLIIEAALPLGEVARGLATRQRALDLFGSFRVWDTEENNGVLLYLNLADRTAELVADRGAARAITDPEWQAICAPMLAAFKSSAYEEGALAAIEAIHRELREAFPAEGKKDNAQPDAPTML